MNPARILAPILIFFIMLLVACLPTPTVYPTPVIQPSPSWGMPINIALQTTITPIQTSTAVAFSEMVIIPGGTFQMGSEQVDNAKPAHMITLNSFLIDRYEVTNAGYAKCVAAKKCQAPIDKSSSTRVDYYSNEQYASYPVVNVSWDDADAYCRWRSARLPTEAEWEKAARGGVDGKQFPWGDTTPVCTYDKPNGAQIYNCPIKDTAAIASFPPNHYNLFDMYGNVWEWVNDWYHVSYYNASLDNNPTGPGVGDFKVLRGNGWFPPSELQIAYRYHADPRTRYNFIGFRCAASVSDKDK
jgi:formylglycine-generating enzyme required for sulfatase activity